MATKSNTTNTTISRFKSAEEQAAYLMGNGMVPPSYKTKAQVVRAILLGENLNMTPDNAVRLIDIIGGNPSLQSKTLAGLMTGAGISIEVIQDWEPIYEHQPVYVLGEDGMAVFDENDQIRVRKDENGNPLKRTIEVDRVTKLRFKRYYPHIGVVATDVEFRRSDAIAADWINKDTWVKMPRFLAMARCISRGSRLIGSDITLALYSTEEMIEFSDTTKDGIIPVLTEEGEVILEEHVK